eukprot:1522468-Amphidinium_carterae.1
MVMGQKYAAVVYLGRYFIYFAFVAGTVLAAYGGYALMEQDPDPPQVFPEDHNVRQSATWDNSFPEFDFDLAGGAAADAGQLCRD